jgi:hypothetical protein
MADDRQSTSAAGGARGYKRSWKNLLINKRYQLRFTLFMVLVSLILMTGLGIWVMKVADEATRVQGTRVRGDNCPPIPEIGSMQELDEADAPTPVEPEEAKPVEPPLPDGESPRRKVVIEESSMTINPVPQDFAAKVATHYECELAQAARLDSLEFGRLKILWVLIASGLLLTFGLAIYGIKMTHKVAGPLYKITLYMGKMRDGHFDKVYNLRKGDQLVDFYEHFKTAHGGVVDMETADIKQLKAVLAAADEQGLAGKSPEIDAALGALREMLARKEKSLE